MTGRDAHPGPGDAPRRGRRRRDASGESPRVAESRDAPNPRRDAESKYAAPPGDARLQAGWVPGNNQAIALTIAEPQTTAMTPDQYQQFISTLSTMIVSWLEDGGREVLAKEQQRK